MTQFARMRGKRRISIMPTVYSGYIVHVTNFSISAALRKAMSLYTHCGTWRTWYL